MYPDLSYLFHDLLGTPVDNWLAIFKTFGFFLAMAFLVGGLFFYAELKRKAQEGIYEPARKTIIENSGVQWTDVAFNGFLGAILGGKGVYAYQNFEVFRHDPASVILSTKMFWPGAIVGALLLGALSWWTGNRNSKGQPTSRTANIWPHDRVSEMVVWAAVGGILGAKLFEAFDNWESFVKDPIMFMASGSGLAFWGGLVLGFVAVVTYIRVNGIPFLPTADAVAPALAAGYGVGRIGCQLSGDGDWGIVNNAAKPGWMSWLPDSMWATRYPHHILNDPRTEPVPSIPIEGCTWEYCMQLAEPVYPTPLYETLMMAVVVGILWALRKRLSTPGLLFAIYLMLVAVERFIIEKIRVNVKHNIGGIELTQAEIIAIILFTIGLAMGGWLFWGKRSATTQDSTPAAD
jgi:phosphatidylglycerol---prolipoprotein diacylglyceryl transferase